MFKLIFKMIYRKQLTELDFYKQDLECKLQKEIKEMEQVCKEKTMQYGLIKRAFNDFKSAQIIGIESNKVGEEVIVVLTKFCDSVHLYLYGKSYVAINQHPRIMATVQKCKNVNYVHIDDIIEVDCNIGNASILMEYFIDICKKMKMQYIRGWLSNYDSGHFDRIEHFYKKFNFDVKFNENRTSGNIYLKL